jgi:Holliday junction resolvase RusA-like endonuclease
MSALVFTVYGLPAPQGSKRHVGNGVMVESSKRVKPWREDVRQAALDAMPPGAVTTMVDGQPVSLPCVASFNGPVFLDVTFVLPRPKSHNRTGRNAHLLRNGAPLLPAGKPDLDKLLRAVMDALTSAWTWRDDAQVVQITTRKVYPSDGTLAQPGAVIRVVAAP